jgi:hypothetical protein
MEELFGNLIYLIPVALVVFRVLSAITGNAKKRQEEEKKTPYSREAQGSPPGRRTSPPDMPRQKPRTMEAAPPEETMDPVMRELLKQFGVSPERSRTERPAARQTNPARRGGSGADTAGLPHWEREKKPAPPKKKQPVRPASAVPAREFSSIFEQPAAAASLSPADSNAARSTVEASPAKQASAPLFGALNPLQQGFVWAELLGQPKALQ